MNSEPEIDPLQDVWQRQPVPVVSAEMDARILRDVEAEESRAKVETGSFAWWLLPVFLVPITLLFVQSGGIDWIVWLILAQMWIGALVAAIEHRTLRRYEREFGATLLGRIERIAARLRLHLRWGGALTAGSTLFSAIAIASASLHFWKTAGWLFVLAGLAIVPLLVVATRLSTSRKRRDKEKRLAELEAIRRELSE